MKILFIENRQQTYYWQEIAVRLSRCGYDIYWIVQNPVFAPKIGKVYKLPFPAKKIKVPDIDRDYFAKVLASDRGFKYFSVDQNNLNIYKHYDFFIRKYLQQISPDIVFGEVTLFHEFLCCVVCKELGFMYVQPTGCRHPSDRVKFVLYDTEKVAASSDDAISDTSAISRARQISTFSSSLVYMRKTTNNFKYYLHKLVDMHKLSFGYYLGERYNTPSIYRKLELNLKTKRLMKRLVKLSCNIDNSSSKINVVFPMHLQPEANVDIWGQPYNNQVDVLRKISNVLSENFTIYLKLNPKCKYEISEGLLALLNESGNIKLLCKNITMKEVLPFMDCVITITGTVALECVFMKKPVLALGYTPANKFKCVKEVQIEKLKPSLVMNHIGCVNSINDDAYDDDLRLYKTLYANSFASGCNDVSNSVWCFDDLALNTMVSNFLCVINSLKSSKLSDS